MTIIRQEDLRNHILTRLSAQDFALLSPHLSPIKFSSRDGLISPDRTIQRTYFIESGIASVIAATPDGHQAEVGLIGREGMIDVMTALGGDMTPLEVLMQASGHGHVMASAKLREAERISPTLSAALLTFAQGFLLQVAYTAVACASLTINERLARWLLMCHDRIDGDEIPITHEFLSLMLNVRRAGVTVAMRELESIHAIESRRGAVIVLYRELLLGVAGAGYGTPEATYAQALAT